MVTRDTNTWQLISEWGHIRNTHHMKKCWLRFWIWIYHVFSIFRFSHAKHGSKQFRQNLIIWSLAEILTMLESSNVVWHNNPDRSLIYEILINHLRFIIMGAYHPLIPKNHPLWILYGTTDKNSLWKKNQVDLHFWLKSSILAIYFSTVTLSKNFGGTW